jgi:glycosyltransferase involved in cell wall biosynthesis
MARGLGMTAPVISVIVPVHNAADTLVAQLDAIAATLPTAPAAEVLIIDNRSSDGSADVATAWAQVNDVDIRVIDAFDQAGEPHARNIGLMAAAGELVAYCDADDQVSPAWLGAIADALEDGAYATGPIDMQLLNEPWIANVRGSSVTGRSLMYELIPYAHGCSMGFRRDALLAVGGFDESYTAGCDLDIAIRMWEAGHELQFSESALLHYRLRSTLTDTYQQGRFYGHFRVRIQNRLVADGHISDTKGGTPRRAAWLLRKSPRALVHRPVRARWAWVLGQLIGERQGRR